MQLKSKVNLIPFEFRCFFKAIYDQSNNFDDLVVYFAKMWLVQDGFQDYVENGFVKSYLVDKAFGSRMESIRNIFHLVFSLVELPGIKILKM